MEQGLHVLQELVLLQIVSGALGQLVQVGRELLGSVLAILGRLDLQAQRHVAVHGH